MNSGNKLRTFGTIAIFAAGIIMAIVVFVFSPEHSSFYPRCLFHALTGLHCPGCGSTRAAHHLLHGNLLTALRCNALLVLLLPIVVVGFIQSTRGRRSWLYASSTGWIIAGFVLAFAFLRNLPIGPFHYLAP